MDKQRLPQWVLDAAHRVGEHMKAQKVIVFGSFARGTQSKRSDLDLFVIALTSSRPLDRMGEVMELLEDAPVTIDAIVYTPDELENSSATFIDGILREGVVAYEH